MHPFNDGARQQFPNPPEDSVIHISLLGDDVPLPKGDGTGITQDAEDFCPDGNRKYNGVGVIYSRDTGIITSAPKNLPAYQAGIREYDVFMNPAGGELPPGIAEIKVMRYGVMMTFQIMTQKICYDTEKTIGM